MIKKLRRKFTVITTVLLAAILLVILIFMYQSAKTALEENAWERLRGASAQLGLHLRPGGNKEWELRSCFILYRSPDGELMAVGNTYYELDDPQQLTELLEKTRDTGLEQGVLQDENLRFLRIRDGWGMSYAYTDISSEQAVLTQMQLTGMGILLVGALAFLLLSVLLARWAVRPVEQAWDQQRQFVADASHELKTPLTVILTNAELLQSEEYDAENKAKFAASILTMSRQMRGLVEELLDQARVDNTVQEHRKLDYSKLISDTVLPFEPVYFEAGRELVCHIEPGITATGKVEHLRRVAEILLDNGCKYSTPGGVVELKLCRQGRGSLLSISSPGVTMTQQQCQDIFKRFYRMDQARSMNHSYGLGLSIAQSIVRQHRGKIWVQSRDGINTFYVSLPQ